VLKGAEISSFPLAASFQRLPCSPSAGIQPECRCRARWPARVSTIDSEHAPVAALAMRVVAAKIVVATNVLVFIVILLSVAGVVIGTLPS
jgi:hypothetical protein